MATKTSTTKNNNNNNNLKINSKLEIKNNEISSGGEEGNKRQQKTSITEKHRVKSNKTKNNINNNNNLNSNNKIGNGGRGINGNKNINNNN